MAKRILIDMLKLREAMVKNPDMELPEAYLKPVNIDEGLKSIRELATFRFTCRRCEDAPCLDVCPAEALEKDEEGIIARHTNLCISCKSCVTICPFGTLMTDFFKHHRNKDIYFDLDNEDELNMFARACPEGVISFVDFDESEAGNIYRLNDRILVKEYLYKAVKQ